MTESPLVTVKANVMLYDGATSSWVASGPGHGVSKVQLYHNSSANTYRIVGWRLQDREVVINCAIVRGLKYQRARQTFHQWRDSKQQVYGLNFMSVEEADQFAAAVEGSLESLTHLHKQQQQQQFPNTMVNSGQFGQPTTTDTGKRSNGTDPQFIAHSESSNNIEQSQFSSNYNDQYTQQFHRTQSYPLTAGGSAISVPDSANSSSAYQTTALLSDHAHPASTTGLVTTNGGNVDSRYYSSSDDSVKGLIVGAHTMVSSDLGSMNQLQNRDTASATSSPTQSTLVSNPSCEQPKQYHIPPPPPLAPPNSIPPPPPLTAVTTNVRASRPLHRSSVTAGDEQEGNEGGFASQLRLKQQRLRAASLAGVGTEHHNSNQQQGVGGRPGVGADMMSDLQRVLAARRRAKEAENGWSSSTVENGGSGGDAPVSQPINVTSRFPAPQMQSTVTHNGSAVPSYATLRKNSTPVLDFGTSSSSNPTSVVPSNSPMSNGTSEFITRADLDAFKRDLLTEFRREVKQLKTDVIEALCASMASTRT